MTPKEIPGYNVIKGWYEVGLVKVHEVIDHYFTTGDQGDQ